MLRILPGLASLTPFLSKSCRVSKAYDITANGRRMSAGHCDIQVFNSIYIYIDSDIVHIMENPDNRKKEGREAISDLPANRMKRQLFVNHSNKIYIGDWWNDVKG
jgi:hypothetical protein